MCGICGIFDKNSRLISCINMNKVQAHRGPDDEGYVFIHSGTGQALSAAGIDTVSDLDLIPYDSVAIENYDLVLGSRRLAILDLSSENYASNRRNRGLDRREVAFFMPNPNLSSGQPGRRNPGLCFAHKALGRAVPEWSGGLKTGARFRFQ